MESGRDPVAEFEAAAENYIDLFESAGKPVRPRGDIYWGIQEGFDLLNTGSSEGEATHTWHWGLLEPLGRARCQRASHHPHGLPPANTLIGSEE